MHSAIVKSNFFRVLSIDNFNRFALNWGLSTSERPPDRVGFERAGKDSFGIPRAHVGHDGRPTGGDLFKDLSRLLPEGEVAVVIEIVISPARAVLRFNAIAVKSGEDPIRLSLNEIYDMVLTKWGVVPSRIDWT